MGRGVHMWGMPDRSLCPRQPPRTDTQPPFPGPPTCPSAPSWGCLQGQQTPESATSQLLPLQGGLLRSTPTRLPSPLCSSCSCSRQRSGLPLCPAGLFSLGSAFSQVSRPELCRHLGNNEWTQSLQRVTWSAARGALLRPGGHSAVRPAAPGSAASGPGSQALAAGGSGWGGRQGRAVKGVCLCVERLY